VAQDGDIRNRIDEETFRRNRNGSIDRPEQGRIHPFLEHRHGRRQVRQAVRAGDDDKATATSRVDDESTSLTDTDHSVTRSIVHHWLPG
jgi:hypothetical protein